MAIGFCNDCTICNLYTFYSHNKFNLCPLRPFMNKITEAEIHRQAHERTLWEGSGKQGNSIRAFQRASGNGPETLLRIITVPVSHHFSKAVKNSRELDSNGLKFIKAAYAENFMPNKTARKFVFAITLSLWGEIKLKTFEKF